MDDYWTPSEGQSSFIQSSGFDVGSDDPISTILQVADKNNQWSAQQAAIQRDWQEIQNQKVMNFNSAEAVKNREWQQYMSNTAHQREIADLKAAGLNPVLSVTGGNGAPVTSGATAQGVTSSGAKGDTDMSATGAVMSWMANLLQAQTAILNTSVSAQASMAGAGMMAGAQQFAAQLAWDAQMSGTDKVLGAVLRDTVGSLGGAQGINSGLSAAGSLAASLGAGVRDAIKGYISGSSGTPLTDLGAKIAHGIGSGLDWIKKKIFKK